jgi:hypothetical protein
VAPVDFCFPVMPVLVTGIQGCACRTAQQNLISRHKSSFETLDTRHSPGMTVEGWPALVLKPDSRG